MQFSEKVKAPLWNSIDKMSVDLSLKNELHKYFGYTTDCPTNASFDKRRSQIKSDAFKYLFEEFTATYNDKPSLFNGYRLHACDGSDINIALPSKAERAVLVACHGSSFPLHCYILKIVQSILAKGR